MPSLNLLYLNKLIFMVKPYNKINISVMQLISVLENARFSYPLKHKLPINVGAKVSKY